MIKKLGFVFLILVTLTAGGGAIYLSQVNRYQLDGEIAVDHFSEEVVIRRDGNGIPYVFAKNLPDLIRGQAFVVGQDRVFQVELYRKMIKGELAELIGEAGLDSDIQLRVMGLYQNAARHAAQLKAESRKFLEWYAEGYNAFLENCSDDFPIELSLLGITPQKISVADLMSVQHYIGFSHSQNYPDEVLALNLQEAVGPALAQQLLPLNINPDRIDKTLSFDMVPAPLPEGLSSRRAPSIAPIARVPKFGSNNWVVGSRRSTGNLPIVVNDPHLDARILPGPWFPIGLQSPEVQAVGAAIPGLPGILLGRNRHLAFGVTNAYGDSQDLYLEDEEGGNYQIRKEEIRIKDSESKDGYRIHPLQIRYTRRGPVISDHEVFGFLSRQPVSLRWTLAELNGNTIGINHFLTARTAAELDSLIGQIDAIFLNFVFADDQGSIGHRASGLVPIRAGKKGALPRKAPATDDWIGYIPKNEMPGQLNPVRGWIGTANHDTRPDSFPYYYSAHFSPYYRYERISEIMADNSPKGPEDHWQYMMDVTNTHARKLTPVFVRALSQDSMTVSLAKYLQEWDFQDEASSVAASIFHLCHEYLLRQIFAGKLSDDLLEQFLELRYFWLQRTDEWITSGQSDWFDNPETPAQETLNGLIVKAGKKTRSRLTVLFGEEPDDWTWGAMHQIRFMSPLRTSGAGSDWLGHKKTPVPGSGETINRGQYNLNEGPYQSQWFSSMRMVADLADPEKIRAVVSGGNAARQFHPFLKSQLENWLSENWIPWWFTPEKINEHKVHELVLKPVQ